MCEFNVILNGKTVYQEVVYAKVAGSNVTVKNVLGESKVFKNCKISEINESSTQIILTSTEA